MELKFKKGQTFEGIIQKTKVKGKIQISGGSVYLCQNDRDGVDCYNKLGYKYSWTVNNGSNVKLLENDVIITKLNGKNIKQPILPITIAGHKWSINKGYVQFGCQKVSNRIIRALAKKLKN